MDSAVTRPLIQIPMKIQQNERMNNVISEAGFDHSCLQKQTFKGKYLSTSGFFNPLYKQFMNFISISNA